ncbi:MAG: efflux RND transporter periplasmic adaptor subunit [Eubacteriales bacterium]|nr:efflux RND transporter periplasmic adaptor subunit [Eubacteriales bacterium]
MENMQVDGKQPKKKGNKKALIIIVSISVVLCIALVISLGKVISGMSTAMQEQMNAMNGGADDLYEVSRQDIQQEITTSGTVVGVDVLAYTSPVTAKVKDICVEVGQTVQKGDVLLKYDPTELGDNLEKVKIQAQSERAMGNESFEQANKAANKAYQAKQKAKELEAEIKTLKADIEKLNTTVETYENKMKQTAPMTTPSSVDKDDMQDEDEMDDEEIEETTPVPQSGLTEKEEQEYKKAMTDLKSKSESLATKQSKLAEQESIAMANEDVTVSESTKAQVSAANRLSEMNVNSAQESYDAAGAGIVAKKKGIVASIDIVKGSYANETQTLFTIIDADKIGVEFVISKDDLGSVNEGQKVRVVVSGHEYTGTIDFISRMASNGMTDGGTAGQIKGRILLDNPDDDIYIGVNAKTYIFVGKSEQTLTVPYSALCSDIDGDYVYVVNAENLIERKDVKIGIYSDEYYEILEGVAEGDKVITKVTSGMKPGDQYVGSAAANPMMPGM